MTPCDFDRQIKPEFHGPTITNDARLLAYREFDDVLRLTITAASVWGHTHGKVLIWVRSVYW
jgi:hypothetical protein